MVNAYIAKDLYGNFHLWLCKSSAIDDEKLAYFKRKVLEALKDSAKQSDTKVCKALVVIESTLMQKSAYPVGTIREWKGKKFVKIAPGKWRPKYDSNTRGAKLAVRAIMRKVDACTTPDALMQIILANKARFQDANGYPLPFVKELSDYAQAHNEKIAGAMKAAEKKRTAKRTQRKPHVDSDVLELCKKNPSDYKYGLKQTKSIIKGKSEGYIRRRISGWKDDIHSAQVALNTMPTVRTREHENNIVVCQAAIDYAREYLFKWKGASNTDMPLLADNIDKILGGTEEEKEALKQKYFKLADTPQALKDKGLTGDYFLIRYGVIARHKGKDSDHNFTANEWKQICKEIANPDNIVEPYKDKKGAYRVTLEMTKDGKHVNVGVDVKSVGRGLEINAVSTVFADKSKKDVPDAEISDRAQFPNISARHDASIPQNGEMSSKNEQKKPHGAL